MLHNKIKITIELTAYNIGFRHAEILHSSITLFYIAELVALEPVAI